MSIREATLADSPVFNSLWHDMLKEIADSYPLADSGPTPRNLNYHNLIFENYTKGFTKGLVLLWTPKLSETPQGLLMVGAKLGGTQGLDSRWERPAWIHGIYIAHEWRRYGGWRALHRAAEPLLVELGFTDTLGYVPSGHEESFRMNTMAGGTPYAILMERPLGQRSK